MRRINGAWRVSSHPDADGPFPDDSESHHALLPGQPIVRPLGINYDGCLHPDALSYMQYLAEVKYPHIPGNRQFHVFRARWIRHWTQRIQTVFYNGSAKAITEGLTQLLAENNTVEQAWDNDTIMETPSAAVEPVPTTAPRLPCTCSLP